MPMLERRCKGQHPLGLGRNSVWAMGCVLLINFGASLLKLPKDRGLTLTEWAWVIKPKTSQALSLREAPDLPRVAENFAQESRQLQWQHCERLPHVNIAELNNESWGSLEVMKPILLNGYFSKIQFYWKRKRNPNQMCFQVFFLFL